MADTDTDKSGAASQEGAAEGAASDTENAGGEAAADGAEDAGADEGDGGDAGADDTKDEDEADDGKEPDTRKKPVDFILARKRREDRETAGQGQRSWRR
jgi:hypothetical protein